MSLEAFQLRIDYLVPYKTLRLLKKLPDALLNSLNLVDRALLGGLKSYLEAKASDERQVCGQNIQKAWSEKLHVW